MADSIKCPNCNANLVFDADRQLMVCEYCMSSFTAEQLQNTIVPEAPEDSDAGQRIVMPQVRSRSRSFVRCMARSTWSLTRIIDGVDYSNVFLLKPGEECEISFPDNMVEYYVVECGVNPSLYEKVYVNGNEMNPTSTDSNGRGNYAIQPAKAKDRTNVKYVNQIDPDAIRTLNIQKKLYEEDGVREIRAENCDARFNFRLYLSGEYDSAITPQNKSGYEAYMYNYHVKDASGNYCYWDSTAKDFRSLNETDFSNLTAAQKVSATFQTSMYGAISKIPAGYTVEVRGLMVGSHYMVEERDNEVPDGYSRRDYYYCQDVSDTVAYSISTDPYSDRSLRRRATIKTSSTAIRCTW